MRKLASQFDRIINRNRDGKPITQERRKRELQLIARQLKLLGYNHLDSAGKIGNRHVTALVNLWLTGGHGYDPVISNTVRNRLGTLRWCLKKVDRGHVMLRNDAYLTPHQKDKVAESKAEPFDASVFERIDDEYVVMSLRLQAAFGLRRSEAIKFQPSYAYTPGATTIQLKPSWAKNGRGREIPVTDESQRILLAECAVLAGSGSLIPSDLYYVDQLGRFDYWCEKVGIKNHSLRDVRII